MKFLNNKKVWRGISVICALVMAICIGLMQVVKIGDYKIMVNNFLGIGANTSGGSADAYAFTSDYKNLTEMLTERKRIAEQLGEEGCVLLKNEGEALPLRATPDDTAEKKVTVLGTRAYTYTSSGALRDTARAAYAGIVGSPISVQTVKTADGTFSLPITLEAGLKSQNIKMNPSLKEFYSNKPFTNQPAGSEANGQSGGPFESGEPSISINDCKNTAEYNDAAFVFIGRSSGEGREYFPGAAGLHGDNKGHKDALGLSNAERNLVNVASQVSDKVIVLINSAVAMEIDELKHDSRVDAILWIGLPGSYGMNGVARVISGAASPSGHLPDVYAVDNSVSPAAQNYGISAPDKTNSFTWSNGGYTSVSDGHYVVLAEGLYTGYRYYETRYADTVLNQGNASSTKGIGEYVMDKTAWKYENETSYTFGYGLSYTQFTQEIVLGPQYNAEDKTITMEVKVTNVGNYPAKDVVQVYVSAPYTDYDRAHGVEKSAIQLIDFGKTETLSAGEDQTISLTMPIKNFASYDKTATHGGVTGGYIMENAPYYFAVGNGAHEALNNVLAKQGVDTNLLYLEDGVEANSALATSWTPSEGFNFDSNGVDANVLGVTDAGGTVQNQMENADYNYYKAGTITYLSRNDWDGTFPVSYGGLTTTSEMDKALQSKVYEWKTGNVTVEFGVDHSEEEDEDGNPLENKTVAAYKGLAYDDPSWDYLVSQVTFEEAWMLSPYGGTSNEPMKSVNSPEVWQIDGPNGNVSRSIGKNAATSGPMAVDQNDPNAGYMSSDMPIEPVIAATFNKELCYEEGKIFGEDGLWSRNTFQWAPGMNLHRTQYNARNHEYYSEDPMLTSICGKEVVRGGLEKGMILSAKHFAFNTQESFREGLCQFMEEQSARELELRAYEDLCYINWVNPQGNKISALGLMSSFSRVGVYGVNAHTGVMKNILRGEWGYKGSISTDMVVAGQFFNPQDSIFNNVTFMATSNPQNLLNGYWPDYNNKAKVKNDPELMQAIYDNVHNFLYTVANSNVLNGITPDMAFVEQGKEAWEYVILGGAILFGTLAVGGMAMIFIPFKKKTADGTDCDEAEKDENEKEVETDERIDG